VNREQRRALERRGLGQPTIETTRVDIKYGVDAEGHVLLGYNRPIDNLRMTPAEAQAMVDHLQGCLNHLKEQSAAVPAGSIVSSAPSTAQ